MLQRQKIFKCGTPTNNLTFQPDPVWPDRGRKLRSFSVTSTVEYGQRRINLTHEWILRRHDYPFPTPKTPYEHRANPTGDEIRTIDYTGKPPHAIRKSKQHTHQGQMRDTSREVGEGVGDEIIPSPEPLMGTLECGDRVNVAQFFSAPVYLC